LNIAIVEDEQESSENLKGHLERFALEQKCDFSIKTYPDAIEFLHKYTPMFSIVFMDIDLPFQNGMSAARELRELDKEISIVFTTKLPKYAIKGYSVDATDFVVKPINYKSFCFSMKHILKSVKSRQRNEFIIKSPSQLWRIDISDIYYIESIRHQVIYETKFGQITSWDSLKEVVKRLPMERFSYSRVGILVNLQHVYAVDKDEVTLSNGAKLYLTRSKKSEFVNSLTSFFTRI